MALAGAVLILCLGLAALSKVKPKRLKAATAAIVALMGMTALLAAVTGLLKPSLTSVLGLAALVGVIGLVIYQVASLPTENVQSAVDAISKLFTTLIIVMGALTVFGALGPAAIIGVGSALALVAGLGLIAGALGEFAGNGIAKFMTAVSGGLVQVGTDLSAFAEALTPFLTVMESVSSAPFENLKLLADSIIEIAGGEFLSSIYKLFTGNTPIEAFGEQMPALAQALSAYANALDDSIDYDKVLVSAQAVELLASLTKDTIPDGGVIGWLTGNDTKISDFASQLPELATALSAYCTAINETDFVQEKIDASANLITILSDLTNNNIPEGGVIGWLKGNKTKITDFASQLPVLAAGLSAYASIISLTTFDSDKIEASRNLASVLASLAANEIPDGGIIGWIHGNDEKISDFALQIPTLATAVADYVRIVSKEQYGGDAIKQSTDLVGTLAALASGSIPDGGIIGWIHGNSDKISNFSSQLRQLASGVCAYVNVISNSGANFGTDQIDKSTALTQTLAELAKGSIPDGGIIGWIHGNSDKIKNFAVQLAQLARGVCAYVNVISSSGEKFGTAQVQKSTALAQTLAELAKGSIPDGGIIGWIHGNSDKIKNFAVQLAQLARGVCAYVNVIASSGANFGDEQIDKSAKLAETLGALCKGSIPTGGIIGWLKGEGDIKSFGGKIMTLGRGVANYVRAISLSGANFSDENVAQSTKLAETLGALCKGSIPTGGIIGWLKGEPDISGFGKSIPELARGLVSYVDTVSAHTFDEDAITNSTNLVETLGALAKGGIPTGGIIGLLSGTSFNIALFASQLPTLGRGIADYVDIVSAHTFDEDAITNSTNLAETLGALAKGGIPTGGIIGLLSGTAFNLTQFASQLPTLGRGIADYVEEVKDAEIGDGVSKATQLASVIAALAKDEIPKNGLLDWITGNSSNIENFGTQLPILGEGLNGFLTNLSDEVTTTTKFDAAAHAIDVIGAVAENFGNFAYMEEGLLNETFTTKLRTLGESLSNFTNKDLGEEFDPDKLNSVSEFFAILIRAMHTKLDQGDLNDPEKVQGLLDNIDALVAKVNGIVVDSTGLDGLESALNKVKSMSFSEDSEEDAAKSATSGYAKSITDNSDAVEGAMTSVTSTALSSVDTSAFASTGTRLIAAMADAIWMFTGVSAAVRSVVSSAVGVAGSYTSGIYETGKYFAVGYANGITENTFFVRAAAIAMVRKAKRAVEEAQESGSPSKVTKLLGGYFGEGFALGIDATNDLVTKSAGGLGSAAVDNLNTTIKAMSDILGSEIEGDPVIRPVLDLSEIQNGASYIGDMLNANGPVGINTNFGAISANLSRSKGATTDDVVSALSSLKDTLGSRTTNNYNINGVTYDDGSNITDAVSTLVRAVVVGGRA